MALTEHERTLYRMARREGYPPPAAYYVARPSVVELVPDDYADAFEAGRFEYKGQAFAYRVEWDDDCLCYDGDPAALDEDRDQYEHTSVKVWPEDRPDDYLSVGSVCSDERTPVRRRAAEHHRAEVMRDLASEMLDTVSPDQLTLI
jgi:hypothetical protein